MFIIMISLISSSTLANTNDLPVNYYFLFPLQTNWWDISGFAFGGSNAAFGGRHVAVDTKVALTPTGTPVFAPCSGRVVISDNQNYGGYGADSAANPNYRGYLVLIECRLREENYITVVLGHLKSGSRDYDQNAHRGLVPVEWNIKAGEYVGQVADYWHGSGFTTNWHHLHFGIRLGRYDVNNQAQYVRGYESSGWTGDDHESWVNPTEFVLSHQSDITWHVNGTLTQVYGQSEIYQIIDGRLWHIVDGDVFAAHNFAGHKVVLITQEEFNCYERDQTGVDWAPWRRLVQSGGKYYMHEKRCADCGDPGFIYEFSSAEAVASWNYSADDFETISAAQLSTMRQTITSGGTLYLREGMLIRDGSNNYFVMEPHGVIRKFAREEYFWRSGYSYDNVIEAAATDISDDYFQMGAEIGGDQVYTCRIEQTDEYMCDLTEVLVSYSGPPETENIGECRAERVVCLNYLWVTAQAEVLPGVEIGDNLDNDCDGEVDEDFVVVDDPPDVVDDRPLTDISEPDEERDVQEDESDIQEGESLDPVSDSGETDVSSTDDVEANDAEEILGNTITCDFDCPEPYQVHVWFGGREVLGSSALTVQMAVEEICLRSAPWIDFNCALPDWRLFDPSLATIECDAEFWRGLGLIEPRGEGELWFTDISCAP